MLIQQETWITPLDEARTLHLYSPDGLTPGQKVPVLYMFDGHNLFVDEEATYGKSWGLKDYLELTRLPLVVVGLECNHEGNRRLWEFSPYDFADPVWGEVQGQGELHLKILRDQIMGGSKIDIEYFAPRIPYRETITKTAAADYRHKKQSGGAGQFGEVHLVIEPYYEGMPEPSKYKVDGKELTLNVKNKEEYDLDWGGKLQFYSAVVGGAIDARFMPAILKGIMEKMEEGPLTGSYARDIRVIVYDGKMHPVDSNEISFKLAGRNAFKEAFRNAGPKIMEPIYNVEVLVPSDKMGDVMSDMQNRRAIIEGMSSEGGLDRLSARVPLSELYRYSTTLSSLTNGRATYTMKFASYEQVPSDIQEKLLKAYADTDKDE